MKINEFTFSPLLPQSASRSLPDPQRSLRQGTQSQWTVGFAGIDLSFWPAAGAPGLSLRQRRRKDQFVRLGLRPIAPSPWGQGYHQSDSELGFNPFFRLLPFQQRVL